MSHSVADDADELLLGVAELAVELAEQEGINVSILPLDQCSRTSRSAPGTPTMDLRTPAVCGSE